MTAAELRYLIATNEIHNVTRVGVKLTDIANRMGVSKVSVYRAAERLERNGYIMRDEKNKIVITDYGRQQLNDYLEIIEFIRINLISRCGTPEEQAYQDALGVACVLSDYSRGKVAEFVLADKAAEAAESAEESDETE